MARERTQNNGVTSLNGAINDSTTTVTVNDASEFSSQPQFRIIVDVEIMLVTGISGNDLTVVRGAEGSTATGHTDGQSVSQILTREGLQRYHRDWNNPYFDAATPMQLLDASGNTLTSSSFTDVNFTNAQKADSSQGSIVLTKNAQGASNDYALIVKSAPSPPWTLKVGFIPNLLNEVGDFPSAGVVVRDSATGEFYTSQVNVNDSGYWLQTAKFASPTSSSTAFLAFRDWSSANIVWMQVEDNNTNLIFSFSADGFNYLVMGQEARTTFLNPDQIGFTIHNFGGSIKSMVTIVAWEES